MSPIVTETIGQSGDANAAPPPSGQPPSWLLLIGELRSIVAWVYYRLFSRPHNLPNIGGALPVITLPGFMASDLSMRQLRSSLRAAGFRAYGWGLGRNRGTTAEILDQIDARVDEVIAREGRLPALVGWSLGGLFAREYAKTYPEKVARVITMGTPFSGSRRANHAWRFYEMVAGHDVDTPPVPMHPAAKPAVHTVALWSASDGIVAAHCARGMPHERDVEVEVRCRHISFSFAPAAARAVVHALV